MSELGAGLPAIGVSRVGKTHCAISHRGQCLTTGHNQIRGNNNHPLLLPSQPVHWESKPVYAVGLFCEKLRLFRCGLRLLGRTESVWRLAPRPRSGAASSSTLLLLGLLLGLQSMADIDLGPSFHPSQGELTRASRPTGAISRVQIYMCEHLPVSNTLAANLKWSLNWST